MSQGKPSAGDPDDIQGNSLVAFAKPCQAIIGLAADDGSRLRAWLRGALPAVTSLRQVTNYRALRRANPREIPRTVWLHVSLSSGGAAALGARVDQLGEAFSRGMLDRVPQLSERSNGSIAALDRTCSALAILGADSSAELGSATERFARFARRSGLQVRSLQIGASLPGGVEHFGNLDGISQPEPEPRDPNGSFRRRITPERMTNLEEDFVLMPRLLSSEAPLLPDWSTNGTFLAYLRLVQDVERLRRFSAGVAEEIRAAAPELHFVTPALVEAKLLGRWASGARISGPSAERDAGRPAADAFGHDPDGIHCPFGSHISKAFPRDRGTDPPAEHRILRRGIPFGAPYPLVGERGLLFMCYQSSLEQQFEHVFRHWCTPTDFPRPGSGTDPFIGRMGAASRPFGFAIEAPGGRPHYFSVNVPGVVQPTECGYFFSPSLSTMRAMSL